MSTSRVEITEEGGVPALFSGTEIANNVFNKELSATVRALGILYVKIRSVTMPICPGDQLLTVGLVSGIGITGGSPYTVAEEEKTMFFTLASFMACNKTIVPVMLL